jgi:multidrug efflux pump subunit AcrA (membrane-fusion protein)
MAFTRSFLRARWPIVTGAIAIIAIVALGAWLRASDRSAGLGGGETVVVERRVFASTVTAIGAVKPQIGAEVRVGSRISGRVQRLRANIGDRVRKGQVIAELETAELDALIGQRRAELKLAEAKRAAIDTMEPGEIARAEAEVAGFEATAQLAAEEWQRQQVLLSRAVVTRAEAEAARERHSVAQAQLESARRNLELVRRGNTEQRRQTEADFERAKAALQSAQVDRSFTILTAPIDGIVASVSTQEGETVAAGLSAPTFVTIVDLGRLQVDAYVDEVDIGKVQLGQSVVFTVDAFPADDFKGSVSAIYPSATIQDNVVKYVVAISVEGGYAGRLRPEMTASVRIQLEQRSALAVPSRAVRREGNRSVVYVVKDGEPQPATVRLGWRDGAWVEIAAGLEEGDRILMDPPVPETEES